VFCAGRVNLEEAVSYQP